MSVKKKLVALFACFALCASFVPVLAIADPVDDETIEAEDIELTTAATGIHVAINKSTGGPDAEGKFTFDNGSAVVTYNGAAFPSTQISAAQTGDKVSITPTPAEGYTAYVTVDGNQVSVAANTAYIYTIPNTVADNGVVNIDVDFVKPGQEPPSSSAQVRDVTVTVDSASLPLLSSNKAYFKIGSGDGNDVTFSQNGATVTITNDDEHPDVLLSFAIDNRYFIPTVIVNGTTYETYDTGEHDSDHDDFVVIGVDLTGDAAKADAYNINLTIGAIAQVDLTAQSVRGADARCMLVEEGTQIMPATTEVDLAVADTATDTAVDGAVATFDLGLTLNGESATEIDAPLDISMMLDTSVYTASDYVVVRNHEGTITELDTTYDAATGRLSFASDQFSDYSLVDKSVATKADGKASKTTLAKTGDPLAAGGVVAMNVIALGAVAFATRKLREQH